MDICFKCGRAGHWAKDCDSAKCPKCQIAMDLHTQLGVIECAWRGAPCETCGYPPHHDGAEDRCARYEHRSDSQRDRDLREATENPRDADADLFYRRRRAPLVTA